MKALRCGVWLLAGLALVGSVGCSGSKKIKVAFVTNNNAEFWNLAEIGANKAAEEEDVEVIFRKPPSPEMAAQTEIIEALLNQNIKALSVSVKDPKSQEAALNSYAGKVPLLAIDNDAPKSKRLAYIGTDNYAAGRAAGKLVKEAIPEGGNVVFFVGEMTALNSRQRRQGVIDELAGKPATEEASMEFSPPDQAIDLGKYKIHSRTFTDNNSEATCQANAESAISQAAGKGPKCCMVGLWAYNAPKILLAVKDEIKKGTIKEGDVKIVSFDENLGTLKGIENGEIHGTIVQQPYQFGYRAVKVMAALARDDKSKLPAGGIDHVPYRIVTREAVPAKDGEEARESAAEFTGQLLKMLGK